MASSAPQYTPPFSMAGVLAVQPVFTVYTMGTSTTIAVTLEGSPDQANWTTIATYTSITTTGYQVASSTTSTAFRYVRVKTDQDMSGALLTCKIQNVSSGGPPPSGGGIPPT